MRNLHPLRDKGEPCEADVDDMYWELDKEECLRAIRHAIGATKKKRREKVRHFALHKEGDKNLDRFGGSTSQEFRILSEDEVLRFVRWDMFENTMVVCGLVVLMQGKRGVPIGGHLTGHTAELRAMFEEEPTFSPTSTVSQDRQQAWQQQVNALGLQHNITVVLPGAEPFFCMHAYESCHLLGDVWAARNRHTVREEDVHRQGLQGWWTPADRLLAWATVDGVDVPILGVVPWDSAPGGRTNLILQRTPRRDTERVRTFLSKFHPTELLIGELGGKPTPPQIEGPCVMLARFRGNIYIMLVNMMTHMAKVMQSVIMQLLKAMYGVPLKREEHGEKILWCEACVPDTTELRLLRKGVVLNLEDNMYDQAEWARWLPATAPNATKVMRAQIPALLQKSLWMALSWEGCVCKYSITYLGPRRTALWAWGMVS